MDSASESSDSEQATVAESSHALFLGKEPIIVFRFRGEAILAPMKDIQRIPVLNTALLTKWAIQKTCDTCHHTDQLAKLLNEPETWLEFDQGGHFADLLPTAGHLRAVIHYAHTNQLDALREVFTYDEARRVTDALSPALDEKDYTHCLWRANKDINLRVPSYLGEVFDWPNPVRRPRSLAHWIARFVMYLTPDQLAEFIRGFTVMAFIWISLNVFLLLLIVMSMSNISKSMPPTASAPVQAVDPILQVYELITDIPHRLALVILHSLCLICTGGSLSSCESYHPLLAK